MDLPDSMLDSIFDMIFISMLDDLALPLPPRGQHARGVRLIRPGVVPV